MHDVLQNCDSLEESVKVIPSSNLLKSPNLTQPLSNLGTLSLDSMPRMEETNPETEEVEEIDLYQHTMHAIGKMHRYRGTELPIFRLIIYICDRFCYMWRPNTSITCLKKIKLSACTS